MLRYCIINILEVINVNDEKKIIDEFELCDGASHADTGSIEDTNAQNADHDCFNIGKNAEPER